MEYSAIGKALLDSRGRIVEANPSLARILGTTQQALVGQALGEQFADADDPLRPEQVQATRGGVHRTTRRLRRGDGEVRHAQLTFAPVPGEVGQDVVGLVQDLEQVVDARDSFESKPNRDDFDRFNQNKLLTNVFVGVAVVGAGLGTILLVNDLDTGGEHARLLDGVDRFQGVIAAEQREQEQRARCSLPDHSSPRRPRLGISGRPETASLFE